MKRKGARKNHFTYHADDHGKPLCGTAREGVSLTLITTQVDCVNCVKRLDAMLKKR